MVRIGRWGFRARGITVMGMVWVGVMDMVLERRIEKLVDVGKRLFEWFWCFPVVVYMGYGVHVYASSLRLLVPRENLEAHGQGKYESMGSTNLPGKVALRTASVAILLTFPVLLAPSLRLLVDLRGLHSGTGKLFMFLWGYTSEK